MWKIYVEIENLPKEELSLQPSSPVGNMTLSLTSKLDTQHNWSEYTFWFPERNIWLELPRNSLDEYYLYNGACVQFLKTTTTSVVILPDLSVIECNVDICLNMLFVVKNICEQIKLRRHEELSLIIFRNSEFEEQQKSKSKKSDMSPNTSLREMFLHIIKLSKSKREHDLDINILPLVLELFPKCHTLLDWSSLHEKWVISSQSLKSQGFQPGDVLYLRYRYTFFNSLNQTVDPVRFYYIFAHCAHTIKTQELKCEEGEMFDLCCMLWQVLLLQDGCVSVSKPHETPQFEAIDDIDAALSNLENSLTKQSLQTDSNKGAVKCNMYEIIPSKLAKNAHLISLNDDLLTIFKGTSDNVKSIVNVIKIKGITIHWNIKLSKNSYSIQILGVDRSGKSATFDLKFEERERFIDWLSCLRSVNRGLSIPHPNLDNEKAYIRSYLKIKHNIHDTKETDCTQGGYSIDDFFPPWFYKSVSYSKDAILDKLFEQSQSYSCMSLYDVQKTFIYRFKGLTFSSIIPFKVTFNPSHDKTAQTKKKSIEILGVFNKYIAQIDTQSEQIVKKWSFFNLKQWNINWQSNTQVFNFDTERVSLVSLSCDIRRIHECVGGNIYMNTAGENVSAFDMPLFIKLTS